MYQIGVCLAEVGWEVGIVSINADGRLHEAMTARVMVHGTDDNSKERLAGHSGWARTGLCN